jgi:hypothetical protein
MLGGEGVGGQYFEDARHSSVLYICKYFVAPCLVEGRPHSHSVHEKTQALRSWLNNRLQSPILYINFIS